MDMDAGCCVPVRRFGFTGSSAMNSAQENSVCCGSPASSWWPLPPYPVRSRLLPGTVTCSPQPIRPELLSAIWPSKPTTPHLSLMLPRLHDDASCNLVNGPDRVAGQHIAHFHPGICEPLELLAGQQSETRLGHEQLSLLEYVDESCQFRSVLDNIEPRWGQKVGVSAYVYDLGRTGSDVVDDERLPLPREQNDLAGVCRQVRATIGGGEARGVDPVLRYPPIVTSIWNPSASIT